MKKTLSKTVMDPRFPRWLQNTLGYLVVGAFFFIAVMLITDLISRIKNITIEQVVITILVTVGGGSVLARSVIKGVKPGLMLISCMIFVYFLLTLANWSSYQSMPTTNIKLHLNDNSVISSNDSSFYIGATRDFYFLYNSKSEEASIIPAIEVIRVERSIIKKRKL